MAYQEEKLRILANTYPQPSTKYRETNCVAAVSSSGEMRRLFPVPYRLIEGEGKFNKWEWITAKITKATGDNRPESYRIDTDSIERHGQNKTDMKWNDRLSSIRQHVVDSFEELEQRRQNSGETLGVIGPIKLIGLDIEEQNEKEWTKKELAHLQQEGLFDSEEVRNRSQLRKLPVRFYYRYQIDNSPIYRHYITDWEAGTLYWNCVKRYGLNWEEKLRGRLEEEFMSKKDLLLLMGTVHRFPDQWLIISLIYPPKGAFEAQQLSLFG